LWPPSLGDHGKTSTSRRGTECHQRTSMRRGTTRSAGTWQPSVIRYTACTM
jgi:hypothetical protein